MRVGERGPYRKQWPQHDHLHGTLLFKPLFLTVLDIKIIYLIYTFLIAFKCFTFNKKLLVVLKI